MTPIHPLPDPLGLLEISPFEGTAAELIRSRGFHKYVWPRTNELYSYTANEFGFVSHIRIVVEELTVVGTRFGERGDEIEETWRTKIKRATHSWVLKPQTPLWLLESYSVTERHQEDSRFSDSGFEGVMRW